jgi:ribose transport system permease protein
MRGTALRTILFRGRLSLIIAALLLVMAVYDRSFFLPENLLNILSYSSSNGILAAGMTLLMISREFDISVGSTLVLSGVIAVETANLLTAHHVPCGAGAGLALGVASGGLMGLINGLLVAKANINSFIATLGTMVIYQGIAFALTDMKPVACDLESFQALGGAEFGGVPSPILYFAIIALVLWAVLRFTRLGKYAYAIGGNSAACRLLGINADAFRIAYFVICGLCASFAGVMLASKLGAASATFGENVALVVIAAIVLGGVPLSGGSGSMPGVVAAVLLLGLIESMTIYLNIFGYYQKLFFALLLIGVVVWDILHARREDRKFAMAELLQLKGQASAGSGKAIA